MSPDHYVGGIVLKTTKVRHLYIARKDMIELLEAQATVKSSESTIKQEYIIAVLTVVILTFVRHPKLHSDG